MAIIYGKTKNAFLYLMHWHHERTIRNICFFLGNKNVCGNIKLNNNRSFIIFTIAIINGHFSISKMLPIPAALVQPV